MNDASKSSRSTETSKRWARELDDSRERAKVAKIAELARKHGRVLAFDRHPITLAVSRSCFGKTAKPSTSQSAATRADRSRSPSCSRRRPTTAASRCAQMR